MEGYYHNHNGSCAACNDPGKPDKAGDTYQIASYENFLWFAKLANGTLMQGLPAKPAANAVLMKAIDITVDTVDTVGTVGKSWPGIGTGDNPYNGRFNGNGYTVTLTDAAQKTLFGTTDEYAALNAICVKGGYLTQTDSANADITAKDVTLPANQTLKVTINGINGTNGIDSTNDINGTNGINGSNGVFTATLDGTSETVSYKITNGTKELTPGATVLTAESGENSKTTALTFVKPDNAPYAGSYTGTVTFTVSVVETTH